jgi:hypothetical protein
VNVGHGEDGVKCFAVHPGGVLTVLGENMPDEMHAYLGANLCADDGLGRI